MKKRKLLKLLLVMGIVTLLLSACGTENPLKNVPLEQTNEVYGFFSGLWDGLTATLAFLCNLFGGHYGIYQVHNNGNLYDLGFLIGIGAFAKGTSEAVSHKK